MSFLSNLFGLTIEQNDTITILNVTEYKESLIGKNIQLVDVRTANEYRSGHIPKAINIDFFRQSTFKQSFEKFDKNKPLYIYCRSGNRSGKAARIISKMGFVNIIDLKRGYMAWE